MTIQIHSCDEKKIRDFSMSSMGHDVLLQYDADVARVYGMGERFDRVNRRDQCTVIQVYEKFTHQGERTYFPIPFYFTDQGHGVFIRSDHMIVITQNGTHFSIIMPDHDCDVYFFYGSPKEILSQFFALLPEMYLPPKWAFGPWTSANRWNCQKDIETQLRMFHEHNYPATVLVIEAWSDEATFYIWNGATYLEKNGAESFDLSDFQFNAPWYDPQKMIDDLHQRGIHVLLWQVPALKEMEPGRVNLQNQSDRDYAIQAGYVIQNENGSPYAIPRQWFIGAYVPDFSNPAVCDWWMEKRKYLLEMGIDGFKTDGGEFIHDLSVKNWKNEIGDTLQNRYCELYERAYFQRTGASRVLFSRAGFTGATSSSIHWAGDQVSSFDELRSVLKAGLSAGLSGIFYWGFDIGGFADNLPTPELYLRATALAAFCPIMQWHSEPLSGQYGGGERKLNDRSPWNMKEHWQDADILPVSVYYAQLRMSLLPELYSRAIESKQNCAPMMKHMVFDYPDVSFEDEWDEQFLLGDLLIVPILHENQKERVVRFPPGGWYDFWEGTYYEGNQEVVIPVRDWRIPVFLREGGAVALNWDMHDSLCYSQSNNVDGYLSHLVILCGGVCANYRFEDDYGNSIVVQAGEIVRKCEIPTKLVDISAMDGIKFYGYNQAE